MNNNRKALAYTAYFLLILGVVIGSKFVLDELRELMEVTAQYLYTYQLVLTMIYILLGVLLGLDHFVTEIRKQGKWKLNKVKATFLSLPFLALVAYIPFQGLTAFLAQEFFIQIPSIVLGHSFVTSFYKEVPARQ
ncbi:hypothetical protein [Effusibacillus consociatus]|uniref:Uncharacterized protein n=1 Tax=Effusibacillus consociatus TaxID=1117041 RepID=A0ABV9Q2Q1_9BACL